MLVPKVGKQWSVCVDFHDFKKAYLKYCYSLPYIDQLVNSTTCHELICMLDAYQGHYQIPLAQVGSR